MKYIEQLERAVSSRDAVIKSYRDGLYNLKQYMQSSKFNEDTKVEVTDIIAWIESIDSDATDIEFNPPLFNRTELCL